MYLICYWNLKSKSWFCLLFVDSVFLRVLLTVCGFCLQLRIFTDSSKLLLYTYIKTVCGVHNLFNILQFFCGFCKISCLWIDFERYSVLAIFLRNLKRQQNPKRQKITNKVAESTYNSQNTQFSFFTLNESKIRYFRLTH